MADSEAQICNLALSRIGVAAYIDALTDASKAAQVCTLVYPLARDEVLQSAPWPFAIKHATLTLLNETRSNWAFMYSMPADCLQPLRLVVPGVPTPQQIGINGFPDIFPNSSLRQPLAQQRYPFEVEASDDLSGQVVLTDVQTPELLYIAKVTAVGVFSPLFVNALAWRVAQDLAMPMAVKPDLAIAAEKAYEQAWRRALALAFQGEGNDPEPASEFEQVRR